MRLAPRQCERFKVDCVYKAVPIETVTMTMHIGMVGAGYADSPVGGTSGPGGDAAWAAKGKGKGKPTAMGADPGPYGPPPMLPPPRGDLGGGGFSDQTSDCRQPSCLALEGLQSVARRLPEDWRRPHRLGVPSRRSPPGGGLR